MSMGGDGEDSPTLAVVSRERVDVAYMATEAVIALASVLGNLLVVLVVGMNRALCDTTFCFIASLALADIAVGALVIPLAVVVSLGLRTHFYTCLTLSCLLLAITQSSILSLLAIAIDRYLRIKIPTRYCIVVTHQRAWLAVCTTWILSLLTGAVPLLGWHNQQPLNNQSSAIVCTFTSVMSMDYMVYFNFFGLVVAPLVVMVCLYGEIFRLIRRQLGKRAEVSSDAGKYYQKELRLAKSLALVVLLFALCWLPLHIMNCVTYFCPTCSVSKEALYVGIFLSHVNSAVNPLVYAFRIERFRTTLVQLCHRCSPCGDTTVTPFQNGHPSMTEKTPNH